MIAVLAAIAAPVVLAYTWWRIVLYRNHAGKGRLLNHLLGMCGGSVCAFALIGTLALAESKVWDGVIFFGLVFSTVFTTTMRRTRLPDVITQVALDQQRATEQLNNSLRDHDHAVHAAMQENRCTGKKRRTKHIDAAPVMLSNPPSSVVFRYRNDRGQHSQRRVDVKTIEGQYFQGYCHRRKNLRTLRFDRIQGDIADATTGEVIQLDVWRRSI